MTRFVVQIREVSHRVDGEEQDLLADISLDVAAGEFLTIQGRSGSGKSTLMSFMGLLARPSIGTVRINGQSAVNDRQAAMIRRTQVGFVFQNYSLLATRSASENVALPLLSGGQDLAAARRRSAIACDLVGLSLKVDVTASSLSGGEQQRVAIARALVTNPSLILADEPTGALDEVTGAAVMQLMTQRCAEAGVALVVVTHDRAIAAMGDRCVHLRHGRLVDESVH
jgi:putative ABC transport system ATP-binding protein